MPNLKEIFDNLAQLANYESQIANKIASAEPGSEKRQSLATELASVIAKQREYEKQRTEALKTTESPKNS